MRSWIKEQRKKIGFSQEKLAETLDWSHDRIGRIERREQELTPEEIKKLGKAIDLSDEEIGIVLLQEAGLSEIKINKLMPKIREEQRFEIETHVAGICLKETKTGIEILIAKRLQTRELYPNKWECGGGQVWPGENFEEAIKRQMKQEFGIRVKILSVIWTYQIMAPNLSQKKIPGVVFLCEFRNYVNGKGIQLDREEFSEYRWIKEHEVNETNFIEGIKKEIQNALKLHKYLKKDIAS